MRNRNHTNRTASVSIQTMYHPVITMEEARAQGSTPSQLRAIANSLERIAKNGYVYPDFANDAPEGDMMIPPYDAQQARYSARQLRNVARSL